VECICRFGSCYLHQNRLPDHNPCYIDGIVFLGAVDMIVVVIAAYVVVVGAVVVVGTADYPSHRAIMWLVCV
jgi:hypothetical protein